MIYPNGTYPYGPGFNDRRISRTEARDAAIAAGTLREKVLAYYLRAPSPATPDAVAEAIGADWPGVRKRVTELYQQGALRRVGVGTSRNGRHQYLYVCVNPNYCHHMRRRYAHPR